jgi:plasmid stability protein
MPQADFALIAELKARAATAGRPAKKSELLRAGLRLLAAQSPKALAAALGRLEPVKLGRPRQQG